MEVTRLGIDENRNEAIFGVFIIDNLHDLLHGPPILGLASQLRQILELKLD
jgi:hypothetical protein